MVALSAADLDKTFRGKMQAGLSDTDHRYYEWEVDGRLILTTKLSTPIRSKKVLGDGLVSTIARTQLRLPRGASQLRKLVECSMSRDEWWEHVRNVCAEDDRIQPR